MSRHQNGVTKPRHTEKRDWLLKIGRNYMNLNYLRNDEVWNRKASEFCEHHIRIGEMFNFNTIDANERTLYAIIEEDPLQSFDFIQREAVKSRVLFSRMSLFLSGRAIETICTKIFSKTGVNEDFLEMFYERFFSFFLMRPYTWYSLHTLIRASRAHPNYFKSTIKAILRDRDIKPIIIQDYVSHVSVDDCTDLMNIVVDTEFTEEEFDHIALIMYIVYKKCNKTESMFRFMYSKLELCSDSSARNQDFGKLLLYFVQNIYGRDIVFGDMKKMVERHCTYYKNLCLAVLDRYIHEVIALQANLIDEGPRIIIPRPFERYEL